jgi:hypothetical protein
VNTEINPDGLPISIQWDAFVIGASVFIPAVNVTRLTRQMRAAAKERKMKFHIMERVEGGKLGARFWRVL